MDHIMIGLDHFHTNDAPSWIEKIKRIEAMTKRRFPTRSIFASPVRVSYLFRRSSGQSVYMPAIAIKLKGRLRRAVSTMLTRCNGCGNVLDPEYASPGPLRYPTPKQRAEDVRDGQSDADQCAHNLWPIRPLLDQAHLCQAVKTGPAYSLQRTSGNPGQDVR